jgi:hypothetical protein
MGFIDQLRAQLDRTPTEEFTIEGMEDDKMDKEDQGDKRPANLPKDVEGSPNG